MNHGHFFPSSHALTHATTHQNITTNHMILSLTHHHTLQPHLPPSPHDSGAFFPSLTSSSQLMHEDRLSSPTRTPSSRTPSPSIFSLPERPHALPRPQPSLATRLTHHKTLPAHREMSDASLDKTQLYHADRDVWRSFPLLLLVLH